MRMRGGKGEDDGTFPYWGGLVPGYGVGDCVQHKVPTGTHIVTATERNHTLLQHMQGNISQFDTASLSMRVPITSFLQSLHDSPVSPRVKEACTLFLHRALVVAPH